LRNFAKWIGALGIEHVNPLYFMEGKLDSRLLKLEFIICDIKFSQTFTNARKVWKKVKENK
jgi:hypothetical protein